MDLCGPSIPRMLNLVGARITQGERGWMPVTLKGVTENQETSLRVMSIGFLLPNQDDAVIWRGPKKTGNLDFRSSDKSYYTNDLFHR